MADNIKESLSALMDGEASELELHRLLRMVEQDASLKSSWLSYQQIRSVIRQEQRLSTEAHLALNKRILTVIEAEPPFADEIPRNRRHATLKLLKPVGGLAVAASLLAAIFLGVQTTQLVDSGPANQDSADIAAQTEAVRTGPAQTIAMKTTTDQGVAATAVSSARADSSLEFASSDSEPSAQESELRELDEENMKRFRAYIMRHDRLSKINPYARVSNTKKK